jgi:adenylosuccinate synthase
MTNNGRTVQISRDISTSSTIVMATIVLGAQWGDEGKGKLTDILARKVTLCTRAQGGNNAGHTIVTGGITYDFHLLPSGLINPECMNLIGSGVVANIRQMFEELDALETKGLHGAADRVLISDRAQYDLLHRQIDHY